MKYLNPVVRGFHPDPSICKANGKYYLVTSTFQYFPGVNLLESVDLINWRQIGYCLTRTSQLSLRGAHSSGGNFAPTIRYHDGRFYMTTINMCPQYNGNFYVWTDDIYGEWSEPIFVEQEGIDPSLYFENGRAYFISNGTDKNGKNAILQCEIDIHTGKKLTDSRVLWHGSGGRYLEAPHMYKIANRYYLIAAEGGTEYGHMITCARSNCLWGPFEPYPKNPVLTNRDLGGYIIQGAGHGDLIEDENGNWWIFHLAFRQIDKWQPYHHLGRETCLMPVTFDKEGWFTIGEGITAAEVETDRLPKTLFQKFVYSYNFSNLYNSNKWRFLREYAAENYIFSKNSLKVASSPDCLDSIGSPSFVGLHQKEFNMNVSVCVKVVGGEAGLTLYMDELHHYDLYLEKSGDGFFARLRLNIGNVKHVQAEVAVHNAEQKLAIKSTALWYEFYLIVENEEILLGRAQTKYLSSEVAGGFTGVLLGLYCQKGQPREFNEFTKFKCEYPKK